MKSIQWLNANRYRRYPFVEDSTFLAGAVAIPDDFMLDFQLVSFLEGSTSVEMSNIEHLGTSLSVGITIDAQVISFTIPATAAIPYKASYFTEDEFRGYIVFGQGAIDFIADNGAGSYPIQGLAPIEPALISFQDRHRIHSIAALGGEQSTNLTGAIEFREGLNCLIRVLSGTDRVVVSGLPGGGAGAECAPADNGVDCGSVITYINGMHGDELGNFVITTGGGIALEATGAGIKLKATVNESDMNDCGG